MISMKQELIDLVDNLTKSELEELLIYVKESITFEKEMEKEEKGN